MFNGSLATMACPLVADGDSLQIWRIGVNILNKQLWTANKGWSNILEVGQWLTTPQCKETAYYEILHSAPALPICTVHEDLCAFLCMEVVGWVIPTQGILQAFTKVKF
jgi:hypothetical protein